MRRYIRSAAHRKWAEAVFELGVQSAVAAAYDRRPPFQRAYRWFSMLWDADVIRQWTIVTEDDVIDVFDPDTELPLFVGGEQWDAFLAEAVEAGVAVP